jgi:hypothetical protein
MDRIANKHGPDQDVGISFRRRARDKTAHRPRDKTTGVLCFYSYPFGRVFRMDGGELCHERLG